MVQHCQPSPRTSVEACDNECSRRAHGRGARCRHSTRRTAGVGGATLTIDASIDRWFTPEFRVNNPEIIKEHIEKVMRNDPAGYAAAYRVFAESDLVDELHQIRCPTMIVTGEHDIELESGDGSSHASATIPESTVHILPNLRHDILVEAPDEVANLLRAFLSPLPVAMRADGSG